MEKIYKNEVIEICLTTQNDYYDDILGDEWLSLPMERSELEKALKKNKTDSSNPAYISSYCTGLESLEKKIESDCSLILGENAIYKLNELAQSIHVIPQEDYCIIDAIAEQVRDFDDAIRIYQERKYQIFEGCATMEDVAYKEVNSPDFPYKLSDFAERFFDYDKYGETIIDRNIFVFLTDKMSMLEVFV